VDQIDPLWAIKRGHSPAPEKKYEDIHIPRNTPLALYIGILSIFFGFGMTWHIWWMAIISLIGIIICLIIRLSKHDKHDILTAAEVKKIEDEYSRRNKAL
jgi:cytochrome o ubiquinol oxidase subunit 1